MKYDLANTSVKQGIRRRTLPYSIFSGLFGLALMALGGARVLSFYAQRAQHPVEEYIIQFKDPNIPLISEAIATIFGVIAVGLGFKFFLEALALLISRHLIPANAPGPIDPYQTIQSICGNVLTEPNESPTFANAWLNSIRVIRNRPISLLGFRNIGWEQSTTMGVIPYLLTYYSSKVVKKSFFRLVFLIFLLAVTQLKFEQIFEGIPEPVQQGLEFVRLLPTPVALCLALIWVGLMAATVYFLIGGERQRAEVELQSQELSSPKQPQMIYDLFEDVARVIEHECVPNRLLRLTDQQQGGSGVGVSRDFNRQVFLEQQPKLVPAKTRVAGWMAIILGGGSVLFALRTLLLPTGDFQASIPGLVFNGLAALLVLMTGLRFIQIGKILTFLLRFESLGLFVDMRGQVSRSKVVVGAGMLDQVKSENETNRSEMLITYRGARLITEADGIMSTRLLFAMHSDDRVISAIREVQSALDRRVTSGVSIAGVNTSAQSLSDMVNLNMYLKSSNPLLTERTAQAITTHALPAPPMVVADATRSASSDDSSLDQVIRLRAKATVALKHLAKENLVGEGDIDETRFEEAEALFASAERYQNEDRYREAIAAYQAMLDLASLQRF